MGTLKIRREEVGTTVVLRLHGAMDAAAAASLRATIEQLAGRDLVIDFTRVGEFLDLAVATLSRGLVNRTVQLLGLGHHHARLFQYFGVGVAASAALPYWVPEEIGPMPAAALAR